MDKKRGVLSKSWVGPLITLRKHLETQDQKFDLLNKLDRAILEGQTTARGLCDLVCSGLAQIIKSSKVIVFTNTGEENILLSSSEKTYNPRLISSKLNTLKGTKCYYITPADKEQYCIEPGSDDGLYIAKIAVTSKWYQGAFGYLVVQSSDERSINDKSESKTKDEEDFIERICTQLSIGITQQLNKLLGKFVKEAFSVLTDRQLKPRVCLNNICSLVKAFLKERFLILSIEGEVFVEVLVKEFNKNILSVTGSTEEKDNLVKVFIEDSVSGTFFVGQNQTAFICDPMTDYSDVYKWYLGRKEEPAGEGNHSEMAIPLFLGEELYGVINIESKEKNVFLPVHLWFMEEIGRRLSQAIHALHYRIERSELIFMSMANRLEKQLCLIGQDFGHSTKDHLLNIRGCADKVRKILSKTKINEVNELEDNIGSIIETNIKLYRYHKEFVKDLKGFSGKPTFLLSSLVNEAIKMIDIKTYKGRKGIDFEFNHEIDFEVNTNRLLRDVFYNLILNAFQAVERKMKQVPQHKGKVVVKLERGPGPLSKQEGKLNQFCKVAVVDNGIGISADKIPLIFEPKYTSRTDGTGFGLFFAKEFVQGIGGIIQLLKSSELEGTQFEVHLRINKEVPGDKGLVH